MPAKISYWGVSAVQIVTESGTVVLLDPTISRNRQAPVKLDEIGRVDVILVTHVSWDHLGDAFEIAKRTGAMLYGGSETIKWGRRRGVAKEKSNVVSPGGRRQFADVTIQGVQALHVSLAEMEDGHFISGQPLSFIVSLPSGERIYHTGDTAIFLDMKLFAELYRPNITTFSIGSNDSGGGNHISPYESALACQFLGVEYAIPIHYADPKDVEEFGEHLAKVAPNVKMIPLKAGETFEAPLAQKAKA